MPTATASCRFGQAAVLREGNDVTLVGVSRMRARRRSRRPTCWPPRHELSAEVIDLRTLRPLDLDTIVESVKKTNRCVDRRGGLASRRRGRQPRGAASGAGLRLPGRSGGPGERADVPMPYSKKLEKAAYPHEDNIAQAALATVRDL